MGRYEIPIGIHILLIKRGRVLLLRRSNTGYSDGNFCFPSGHLESGEWALDAACRELKEEVGVRVKPKELKLAHVFHKRPYGNGDADSGIVALFFVARRWTGTPKNKEPEKCDVMAWFGLNKLPPNLVPFVRQVLDCYEKGVIFSQYDGN